MVSSGKHTLSAVAERSVHRCRSPGWNLNCVQIVKSPSWHVSSLDLIEYRWGDNQGGQVNDSQRITQGLTRGAGRETDVRTGSGIPTREPGGLQTWEGRGAETEREAAWKARGQDPGWAPQWKDWSSGGYKGAACWVSAVWACDF